jgi:hypothetical protein
MSPREFVLVVLRDETVARIECPSEFLFDLIIHSDHGSWGPNLRKYGAVKIMYKEYGGRRGYE